MTVVLLDTNAYLRLAKRIRPLLGIAFGQRDYTITVLREVEAEVRRSPRLNSKFPWFEEAGLAAERLAKQVRVGAEERRRIDVAVSVLRDHVEQNAVRFTINGRSPPSPTDCFLLAFSRERLGILVTDDLGVHLLAHEFEFKGVWHGHELLRRLWSDRRIDGEKIREIFEALDTNGDLPKSWMAVKHTVFRRVFGSKR